MVRVVDADFYIPAVDAPILPVEAVKMLSLPSSNPEVTFEQVAPAISKSFSLSKPELTPPKAGASKQPLSYNQTISSIISTLEEIHETGRVMHETQTKDLARVQGKIQELQQENIKVVKDAAEKNQSSGSGWSMLQTIGSYILSAINTILGGLLFAQGATLVGGMMIASGLISIANLAFSATDMWSWIAEQLAEGNKEYAKQLEQILPGVVGLIATALSLPGAVQLWQRPDLVGGAAQLLSVMQSTLSLVSGVAAISKGFSDYELQQSHAKQIKYQQEMSRHEQSVEQLMLGMERTMKALTECTSSASRIVNLASHTYERVIRN